MESESRGTDSEPSEPAAGPGDRTCFVIMPISTPARVAEDYDGDGDHFVHVLEDLFTPALESLGYTVIPPTTSGSDVIQASIIRKLDEADLVLCDMSQLNANVFFELGIRTALDKPVCAVVDDKSSTIPFDTSILNYYTYNSSLQSFVVKHEVPRLAAHIEASIEDDRNAMWRYFGVEAQIGSSAVLTTTGATPDDKLDLVLRRLDAIESGPRRPTPQIATKLPVGSSSEVVLTLGNGRSFRLSSGADDRAVLLRDQAGKKLVEYTIDDLKMDDIRALIQADLGLSGDDALILLGLTFDVLRDRGVDV